MQRSTQIKIALLGMLPFLLGATLPGESGDERFTRVSLTGSGYASQSTEIVSIAASTVTFSKSASGAMAENASDMDRLRARLSQLGVTKDDFRTASFRFNQASDPDDNDGERDRGYAVQHQLALVVRKPDKAGAIMDALVSAGAKDLSINRFWGNSEDISPAAIKEARGAAIRDAQDKANDYARALGMHVRRVVSISDQGGYARDRPTPMAWRVDTAATTIETRPTTVLATVGMVVELEK